jgi:hypothetical protein
MLVSLLLWVLLLWVTWSKRHWGPKVCAARALLSSERPLSALTGQNKILQSASTGDIIVTNDGATILCVLQTFCPVMPSDPSSRTGNLLLWVSSFLSRLAR